MVSMNNPIYLSLWIRICLLFVYVMNKWFVFHGLIQDLWIKIFSTQVIFIDSTGCAIYLSMKGKYIRNLEFRKMLSIRIWP